MAKGKHATALFEVIHAKDKPATARRKNLTATPGWWFKSKAESAPKAAPAMNASDAMAAARAELAAANAAQSFEPRVIEKIIEVEKPVYIDRPVPVPTRSFELDDTPLQLDPANHEIKFRLSYVGAIAAGFVLVVALAMAYLIGTRSNDVSLTDPAAATGSTVGDTAPSPAPSGGQSMMAAVAPSPTQTPAVDNEQAHAEAPAAAITSPTVSTAAPEVAPANVERQVDKTYVIVQTYPQVETAQKAADFLNAHGIGCTVIAGPPGWAPGRWSSVIGTQAFDHIQQNPALEAYKQSIDDLATEFAGKQRFIRFKPQLYKWTERSQPSAP